jgi:hypothetical protein
VDAGQTWANGRHILRAGACAGGTELAQADAPFTLANGTQQILKDPGFEAGGMGWKGVMDIGLSFAADGAGAHGLFHWLQLKDERAVSQRVAIPAGVAARLRFWTRVESSQPEEASSLIVEVRRGATHDPATLATITPAGTLSAWTQTECDLTPYAGQKVELWFRPRMAEEATTVFNLDDVSLLCTRPAP